MVSVSSSNFFDFFVFASIVELSGRLLMNNRTLEFLAKPQLMVLLTLHFLSVLNEWKVPRSVTHWAIVAALLFSWLGDVALMLETSYPILFIFGLIFFLIAHIAYIVTFSRLALLRESRTPPFLKRRPQYFFGILGAAIMFYFGVMDSALPSELRIPVIIYLVALLLVIFSTLNREGKTNKESFQLGVFGAIIFFSSDTLLALNRFVIPIPKSGFFVMGTYILAQYLLVKSILSHERDQMKKK
jgi:uncharacterized membrane protein YhhN